MKINYIAKQLIRSSSRGYLSTHFDPNYFEKKRINVKNSFPYSTFTLTAFDYDISPIILLSNLSEHTTNIKKNSLVSLMLCEEQKTYAASDVLYLHKLKSILEDKLEKVNRKELAQDCFNFISTRAYLDLNGWSEIDIFRH